MKQDKRQGPHGTLRRLTPKECEQYVLCRYKGAAIQAWSKADWEKLERAA